MKIDKTEEHVERTLRMLGGAEAPDGMEERVLRRLAAHRPAVRRTGWWTRPFAVAGGVIAVAVVVGVALLYRGAPKIEAPIPSRGQVATASSPQRAVREETPKRVRVVTVARHTERPRAATVLDRPAPVAPLTEQEKLLVRMAKVMSAPPRMPAAQTAKEADVALTHEEVLLVAVSRVRQDAVIEALDPVRRAAADARAKREFNAYVQQKDGGS